MISRRNLREKVMQSIYSIVTMIEESQPLASLPLEKSQAILLTKLENTARNFTNSILYIVHIAEYASKDAEKKASKYRPSDEDLNINTKILGNKFLNIINSNTSFQERVKEEHLDLKIDKEWVKRIYDKLVLSERYQKYIASPEHNEEEDRKILIYIWKNLVLKDENFQDILADEWPGYDADIVLNRTVIDFYFKKPEGFDFYKFLSKDKQEYAMDLLETVIIKEQYLIDLITPKLNNWEPDRIAVIDMILLKMGIAEFLYFPTIPSKVSINEYVDIAKDFSTEESGKFINAVLDNVLQELKELKIVEKA